MDEYKNANKSLNEKLSETEEERERISQDLAKKNLAYMKLQDKASDLNLQIAKTEQKTKEKQAITLQKNKRVIELMQSIFRKKIPEHLTKIITLFGASADKFAKIPPKVHQGTLSIKRLKDIIVRWGKNIDQQHKQIGALTLQNQQITSSNAARVAEDEKKRIQLETTLKSKLEEIEALKIKLKDLESVKKQLEAQIQSQFGVIKTHEVQHAKSTEERKKIDTSYIQLNEAYNKSVEKNTSSQTQIHSLTINLNQSNEIIAKLQHRTKENKLKIGKLLDEIVKKGIMGKMFLIVTNEINLSQKVKSGVERIAKSAGMAFKKLKSHLININAENKKEKEVFEKKVAILLGENDKYKQKTLELEKSNNDLNLKMQELDNLNKKNSGQVLQLYKNEEANVLKLEKLTVDLKAKDDFLSKSETLSKKYHLEREKLKTITKKENEIILQLFSVKFGRMNVFVGIIFDRMSALLKKSTEKIKLTKAEIKKLANELSASKANQAKNIDQENKTASQLNSQIDTLTKKIKEIENSHTLIVQQKNEAENKIKTLQAEIETTKIKMQNEEKISQVEIASLKTNITQIEIKSKELQEAHKKEIENHSQKEAKLLMDINISNKISTTREHEYQKEREIKAKTQHDLEQELKSLKVENAKCQEQINELKKTNGKLDEEKKKCTLDLEKTIKSLKELELKSKEDNHILATQLEAMVKKEKTEEEINKNLKSNLAIAEEKIKSIHIDLTKHQNEEKLSKTEIINLKSNIAVIEAKNKELLGTHKKEIDSKNHEIQKEKESKAKAQQEHDHALKNLKADNEKTITSLNGQIAELKKEVIKSEEEKKKLVVDLEKNMKALKDLEVSSKEKQHALESQNDVLSKKLIVEQESNKTFKLNLTTAEEKIRSYQIDVAKLHNDDKISKSEIASLKSNINLFESKNKELQDTYKLEHESKVKIQQDCEQTIKVLKLDNEKSSAKLQEQIAEVTKSLIKIEEEKKKCLEELENSKKSKKDLEILIKEKEAHNETLIKKIKDEDNINNKLKESIKTAEEKIKSNQAEIDGLKNTISQVEAKNKEMQEAHKKEIESKNQEMQNMNQKEAKLLSDLNNSNKMTVNKDEEILKERENKAKAIQEYEQNIKAQKTENERLISKHQEQVNELKISLDTITKQLNVDEEKIKAYQIDVSKLQDEDKTNKNEISTLKNKIIENENKNKELQDAHNKEVENKIKIQQESEQTIKKLKADSESLIAKCEEEKKTLVAELEKTLKSLKDLDLTSKEKQKSLEAQIETKSKEYEQIINSKQQELNSELNNVREKYETEKKKHTEETEQSLKSYKELELKSKEIQNSLQTQIDSQNKKICDLEDLNKNLNLSVKELEEKLRSSKSDLSKTQSESEGEIERLKTNITQIEAKNKELVESHKKELHTAKENYNQKESQILTELSNSNKLISEKEQEILKEQESKIKIQQDLEKEITALKEELKNNEKSLKDLDIASKEKQQSLESQNEALAKKIKSEEETNSTLKQSLLSADEKIKSYQADLTNSQSDDKAEIAHLKSNIIQIENKTKELQEAHKAEITKEQEDFEKSLGVAKAEKEKVIGEQQEQINTLNKNISKYEEEGKKSAIALENALKSLKDLELKSKEMEAQMTSSIKAKEKELNTMEDKVKSILADLVKSQNDNKESKEEISSPESSIYQLPNNITQLGNKVKELIVSKVKMQGELEQTIKAIKNENLELNKKLEEEKKRLTDDIEKLTKTMENLETLSGNKQKELLAAEEKLKNSLIEINSLKDKSQKDLAELEKRQNDLATSEKQYQESVKTNDILKEEIKNRMSEIEKEKKQYAILDTELKQAKEECNKSIAILEQQNKNLQSQCSAKQEEIEGLYKAKLCLEDTVQKLEKTNKDNKEQQQLELTNIQKENNKLKQNYQDEINKAKIQRGQIQISINKMSELMFNIVPNWLKQLSEKSDKITHLENNLKVALEKVKRCKLLFEQKTKDFAQAQKEGIKRAKENITKAVAVLSNKMNDAEKLILGLIDNLAIKQTQILKKFNGLNVHIKDSQANFKNASKTQIEEKSTYLAKLESMKLEIDKIKGSQKSAIAIIKSISCEQLKNSFGQGANKILALIPKLSQIISSVQSHVSKEKDLNNKLNKQLADSQTISIKLKENIKFKQDKYRNIITIIQGLVGKMREFIVYQKSETTQANAKYQENIAGYQTKLTILLKKNLTLVQKNETEAKQEIDKLQKQMTTITDENEKLKKSLKEKHDEVSLLTQLKDKTQNKQACLKQNISNLCNIAASLKEIISKGQKEIYNECQNNMQKHKSIISNQIQKKLDLNKIESSSTNQDYQKLQNDFTALNTQSQNQIKENEALKLALKEKEDMLKSLSLLKDNLLSKQEGFKKSLVSFNTISAALRDIMGKSKEEIKQIINKEQSRMSQEFKVIQEKLIVIQKDKARLKAEYADVGQSHHKLQIEFISLNTQSQNQIKENETLKASIKEKNDIITQLKDSMFNKLTQLKKTINSIKIFASGLKELLTKQQSENKQIKTKYHNSFQECQSQILAHIQKRIAAFHKEEGKIKSAANEAQHKLQNEVVSLNAHLQKQNKEQEALKLTLNEKVGQIASLTHIKESMIKKQNVLKKSINNLKSFAKTLKDMLVKQQSVNTKNKTKFQTIIHDSQSQTKSFIHKKFEAMHKEEAKFKAGVTDAYHKLQNELAQLQKQNKENETLIKDKTALIATLTQQNEERKAKLTAIEAQNVQLQSDIKTSETSFKELEENMSSTSILYKTEITNLREQLKAIPKNDTKPQDNTKLKTHIEAIHKCVLIVKEEVIYVI